MKSNALLCCLLLALSGCGKDDEPKIGGPDNNANNVRDTGDGSGDVGSATDLGEQPDQSTPDLGVADMSAPPDLGDDMAGDMASGDMASGDMAGVDIGMDMNAEDLGMDMMVEPCGNGVLDSPEECDPAIAAGMPGACPVDCDDGLVCTTESLVGMAADCTARCMPGAPICADGDFCCAGGACNLANDSECFVPSGTTSSTFTLTGPSNVTIGHVELGPNGRKFLAGLFQGTVQLDANTTLTPVNSFAAAWIAEFDANDNVVWVQTATSEMLSAVNALDYNPATDELAVAVGTLGETALTLDGTAYTLDGLNDFLIAKLDASNGGNVQWANVYANPERQIAYDIGFAPDSSIWVAGGFQGTLDFGMGAETAQDWDALLLHLASDGSALGAWTFGSTMQDIGRALVVLPDGSVAMFGEFRGTVDFGGGALTAGGGGLFYGLRVDATGTHLWSQQYSVTGGVSAAALTADGRLVVGGRSRGNPDFGDGAQNGFGDNDAVVGVLDASNGTGLRTLVAGGNGNDYVTAIAATYNGVMVAGNTEGGTDFFGAAFTAAGVDGDAFLARVSPNAAGSWLQTFGGPGEEGATDLAVDPVYNVYLTGTHRSPIDLGLGAIPYDANRDSYLLVTSP